MAKNPKILESVYSIRDIQIFGAGSRRMKEVDEANRNVNHASFWLTDCDLVCSDGIPFIDVQSDLCCDESSGNVWSGGTDL